MLGDLWEECWEMNLPSLFFIESPRTVGALFFLEVLPGLNPSCEGLPETAV